VTAALDGVAAAGLNVYLRRHHRGTTSTPSSVSFSTPQHSLSPLTNFPRCQDLIYTQLTIPAVDYSEFKGLVEQTSLNSLPDPLTSMGITLSTVLPTTPSDFSGLPTYSDNIVSSTSWATASLETPTLASAAVTRSTGGAAVATGVVGVGVWVGVIGMVVGG